MTQKSNWKKLIMDGIVGEVFTYTLFQNESITFGRIKVMPYSKIPYHPHMDDCEWYLDEDTGELVDFCPMGKGHEFCNETDRVRNLINIKKKS